MGFMLIIIVIFLMVLVIQELLKPVVTEFISTFIAISQEGSTTLEPSPQGMMGLELLLAT
ncbi:hypothetical protein BOV90_06035 [Solemya velum gill symbiont]|uniref:Uncharacterized protein n=1 Tax=Solemya velum gill symbiont TaxID=2340 RepID=A0A1T2CPX0_SOVGS|nr:hypothetical protein BOV88_11255 [Solemya velum gill symbiont]OOY36866.1 hypothetical protein BOV89_10170 [Solemya velum gill symbiont]OOY40026.1 hypothetical protein BOV90_06035 [Solemya velum gill symbiont]OOY43450.1 hypothetical protein BOV92_11190 [Solemya velum gill symbiont]OOY46510.1 hypothetical protein BOV93_10065 [Solemya velum gill symbiont]